MPNIEDIPKIDPQVRYVGISKLRRLNADKLRETTETFVVQDNDKPIAVLLTYDKFIAMQDELEAVARTVEMLSNNGELEAMKAGMNDMKAGRYQTLDSLDEELKKGQ